MILSTKMKVFVLACGQAALAAPSNFQMGIALGEAINRGASDPGFAAQVNDALMAGAPRNAAVESAVAAANAKASFLKQKSVINLHIGETGTGNADYVATTAAAQRAQLLMLQSHSTFLSNQAQYLRNAA